MIKSKKLTPERIAEIKAFKTMDFSDCPIQTPEEFTEFRPKHPEYFVGKTPKALWLDDDVLEWLQQSAGENYQKKANTLLRQAMTVAALGEEVCVGV